MLTVEQKFANNVTLFHFPVKEADGKWSVQVTRMNGENEVCIKKTYCLDKEQADIVRTMWINQFWGNSIN